jgi:hypothetical protein
MNSPSILALLAVLPFVRAVHGEFLFDDPNMFFNDGPRGVIFRRIKLWRDDHRAMVHILDSWLFRLFGINETGMNARGTEIIQPSYPWHVLSLMFHVGATLAVWEIAGWFLEPWRAWVAAAIFAVHPLQVQAVAYISGRAGVQAFFFAALGLIHAHTGGYHWAAVPVCIYFAYKSKQDGLLYLALYPVVLWRTL